MATDIQSIFADPDFRKLPIEQKISRLDKEDPDEFAKMSANDKNTIIASGLRNVRMQPKKAAKTTTHTAGDPIRKLFADPEFRRQSSVEKIHQLNQLDPEGFGNMELKDKIQSISTSLQNVPMQGTKEPSFFGTVGGELAGMFKAGVEAMKDPLDLQATQFRLDQARQTMGSIRQGQPLQAAKHLAKGLWGPTASAIVGEQLGQFRQAGQAYQAGERYQIPFTDKRLPLVPGAQAAQHAIAGLVPIIGPAANEALEEFDRGEYGPASAHVLMLIGPDILGGVLGIAENATIRAARAALKSRITPKLATRYTETEARAIAHGYPHRVVTRGEMLDNPTVKGLERAARHVPGASGIAEDVFTGRAGELERQARESVGKISSPIPAGLTPVDLGGAAYGEAGRTIRGMKVRTSTIYDIVERRALLDRQDIWLGNRFRSGQWERVYGIYHSPVNLTVLRHKLRPLYEEFRNVLVDLDESQKMANPGYKSLHGIMNDVHELTGRPREYMNAMDLEKELRNIKASLRDEKFRTFTKGPSGRVALRIINEGEGLIERALNKASPGTYNLLQSGRNLTKQYLRAERVVTEVFGDVEKLNPQHAYEVLTRAGDHKFYQIAELANIAPQTAKAIMRDGLEGLLTQATTKTGRLEAGVGRNLVAGWERFGPKTKQVMIGRQLTGEIDTIFRNIDSLMPPGGSPTAWNNLRNAGFWVAGTAALDVLRLLFTGNPLGAAKVAAGTAATMQAAKLGARLLFSRDGAASINQVLRAAHVGGKVLREAMRGFEAQVAVAQNEQRQEQQQQERAGAPRAGEAPIVEPAQARELLGLPPATTTAPAATPAAPAAAPSATAPAPAPAQAAPAAPAAPARAPAPEERRGSPFAPRERPARGPRAAVIPPAPPTPATPADEAEPVTTRTPLVDFRREHRVMFADAAKRTGVKLPLLYAIATQESGGDPYKISKKGAVGLMGMMPDTFHDYGKGNIQNPKDNINAAANYLKYLINKPEYRGKLELALAAYNAGPRAVARAGNKIPNFPETINYVHRVMSLLSREQLR